MDDRQFYVGVKALVTDSKGNVLVLRKVPRKPSHRWRPFWDLPGGKMKGNSIRNTLIREVREELGSGRIRIGGIYGAGVANFKINGNKDGLMLIVYSCSLGKGTRIRLSEEHDAFEWVRPYEARRRLSRMLPEEFLGGIA